MFSLFKNTHKALGAASRSAALQKTNFARRNINILLGGNAGTIEDEILDALHPRRAPDYPRVPQFISDSLRTIKNRQNAQLKEVVISCKNSNLNHFKNQRYANPDSIPLASKGWNHYKSKGDYFVVKVCDDENFIKNLFWDEALTDFSSYNLNPLLVEALKEIGYVRPTKIQGKAISGVLSGRNCLITAETGCGKTLAYLIPVINQLLEKIQGLPADRALNSPLALILVPSRDLAHQIGRIALKLSYQLPFRCNILVGGRTKKWMLNPRFEQIDLQIATPGALSKLVTTGLYDLSNVQHVILDEGDTMLDDSFIDLTKRILKKIKIRVAPSSQLATNSQMTIVSATLPRDIYKTLDSIVEIDSLKDISSDRKHQILPHVTQSFYRLGASQKAEKLLQLVKKSIENKEKVIVFSNKTKTCDWISMFLQESGVESVQLNKSMPVVLRQNKLTEFESGGFGNVLSSTDIASRGLDTVGVSHIINYEFPRFMADYVHRCGRTGRVGSGSNCRVSNFITTGHDVKMVQRIETAVRQMSELPGVNGNISKIIQDRLDHLEGVL